MKLTWKLVPVAAVTALALLALMPGGGVRPADVSADVSDVAISDDQVNSGESVTISFTAQQDDGSISVTVEGAAGGTAHLFTVTECGDGCGDDGDSSTSPSISSASLDGDDTVELSLQVSCTSNDTITIRASQDDVSDTDSVECLAPTTPTTTPTTTGTPSTATPTATGTSTGNTITLSAVQPNTGCGQPVFLFATVKNSNGNFVAGATVTFTASGGAGSFAPSSAVTVTDGVASSTYSPPNSGNQTVTITATSGGKTATASVPVNCGSPATATPTAVQSGGGTTVRPPSTGDGGLASGSDWSVYAGLAALVGTVFVGALVVARRRA